MPHAQASGPADPDFTRVRKRAAQLSLVVGVLVAGAKFLAFALTGSAALLSDAAESVVNVVAAAFALYSVHLAAAPADDNHPYGHGKIEFFSALIEGGLILAAAVLILVAAAPKILHPVPLESLDLGLAVSVAASVANALLGIHLVKVGKHTESITLVADGKHVLTDVVTTAGVLVGLTLVRFTGLLWLDPVIACVVALHILHTGFTLIREAVRGLMDEADAALIDRICAVFETHRAPDWLSIHALKAQRYGGLVHIDLHLLLPRRLSFPDAQAHIETLEAHLVRAFEGRAEVMIKADVCDDPTCATCAEDVCAKKGKDGA